MFIDDGAGKGIQAFISTDNQLLTKSATSPLYSYYSREKGTMFHWISTYAATANDWVMTVTNNDQANYLRLNRLIFANSVAAIWSTWNITSGTPGGTRVTPINMNWSSGKVPAVAAYGNAAVTGTLTGTAVSYYAAPAANSVQSLVEGALILPVNTTWGIKTNQTGTVYVIVEGWLEPI